MCTRVCSHESERRSTVTSVPSTGNFALAPRRQEDDIPGIETPPWLRRSRSSCRRLLSSPLSYGRFRENYFFRERTVRPWTTGRQRRSRRSRGEKLEEDERRVRRRHSEFSRSGAPLFIPHVMPCGRYVMLLLPVNFSLARSFSLITSLFIFSIPFSIFFSRVDFLSHPYPSTCLSFFLSSVSDCCSRSFSLSFTFPTA